MQQVTTELRVRDTSVVAMERPGGEVAMPPGQTASDAPLGEGRATLGAGATTAYSVRARREADHSLSLEWTSALPIANGERHVAFPSNGSLVFQ